MISTVVDVWQNGPGIDVCQYGSEEADGVTTTELTARPLLPVVGTPSPDDACCVPLRVEPLGEADAVRLARRFAALGDPVRLRLLSLLASSDGPVCACDLVEPVDRSQPTVSHHLKVLREAGLVTGQRRGSNVWYAVVPEALTGLHDALGPTP